jgi:hypothetical protein
LPWDGPITTIESDLQGTVAHALIILAIVATGLMFAFGEHGSSMRKIMGIAAGGSIALGAASLVSGLGLGSGAVIGGSSADYTNSLLLLCMTGALLVLSFGILLCSVTLVQALVRGLSAILSSPKSPDKA